MRHTAHLETLRELPEFRTCSDRDLREIARIVDTLDIPAGTVIGRGNREVVLTLEPTRVLVVGNRVFPALCDICVRPVR